MKNFNASVGILCFVLAFLVSCVGEQEQGNGRRTSDNANSISSADTLDFTSYSPGAVVGETVYVPVYSHIYQHNRKKTFNLTATLSLRNTDLISPITLQKVYYYDSDGQLVYQYLDEPKQLAPLSSTSFVVEEEDLRGGVGANFLVLWEAQSPVTDPIIEAVMISTTQQQGISFVSGGRVIDRLGRTSD